MTSEPEEDDDPRDDDPRDDGPDNRDDEPDFAGGSDGCF
jgi:hypothetical protein